MDVLERSRLESGKKIVLYETVDGKNVPREFTIDSFLDDGGSVICYNAHHSSSGIGILKEYYPDGHNKESSLVLVKRTDEGHVVPVINTECMREKFEEEIKEFSRPYETVMEALRNENNKDISTFIPPFTVYRDLNENGNSQGSVYIWFSLPESVSFQKICEELLNSSDISIEEKLYIIMKSVESLAECIETLHYADLVHCDIKPENFGVMSRQGKLLFQHIILFDIDSVINVFDNETVKKGTAGYCDPEITDDTDCQTDIYSIGATLYYALFGRTEMRYGLSGINVRIDNLDIIKESEINNQEIVRDQLAIILKKCLSGRSERYQNCEELIDDIKVILRSILPPDCKEMWTLNGKNQKLKQISNVVRNLQNHLYTNPLYRWSQNEKDLNVLVIGFDETGKKFLDLCLEVGQVPDGRINADIISLSRDDNELYLKRRPELSDFFNIDGSVSEDQNYGNIGFLKCVSKEHNNKANTDDLAEKIEDILGNTGHKYGYVFISLGESDLNIHTAELCSRIISERNFKCCVNYTISKPEHNTLTSEILFPVDIYKDSRAELSEIERMAFNVNIVWGKNLLDYKNLKREFRKNYNYNSSVSNVLSLKYKLYSIGIDLDSVVSYEAARRFNVFKNKDPDLLNKLIWSEHKRWVTKLITDGWTRQTDLHAFDSGVTKNEEKKKHLFILRSDPENQLTENFFSDGTCRKWDKASDDELSELDELDRVSVELHRVYFERARERINSGTIGPKLDSLRDSVRVEKKLYLAFQEWCSCIKDIMSIHRGKSRKINLYYSLKNNFYCTLAASDIIMKQKIKKDVQEFERLFNDVLECVKYTDYKLIDRKLVDNIPFILTYNTEMCLAIPLVCGTCTDMFSNLAAAAIVNPLKIIYLTCISERSETEELSKSISYITSYIARKKIRSEVEFYVLCSENILSENTVEFEIKQRGVKVRTVAVKSEDDISSKIEKRLKRPGNNRVYIEKNTSYLSELLRRTGVENSFSNYEFDMINQRFINISGCDELTYISKTDSICAADMFMSADQSDDNGDYLDFDDEVWEKYCEDPAAWKRLCRKISDFFCQSVMELTPDFRSDNEEDKIRITYILPLPCLRTIKFVKQRLEKYINDFSVITDAFYSCKIRINDTERNKQFYDMLFADPYPLMDPESLFVSENESGISFKLNNLLVRNLKIGDSEKSEIKLLDFLERNGLISGLEKNNNTVSFCCSTHRIKEMLTDEYRILKMFLNNKIKETGYFDDMICNPFTGSDVLKRNKGFEFVLTKGFTSLFVVSLDRCDSIEELSGRGINTTAFVIIDPEGNNDTENLIRKKFIPGSNVIVISEKKKINNIGNVLTELYEKSIIDR